MQNMAPSNGTDGQPSVSRRHSERRRGGPSEIGKAVGGAGMGGVRSDWRMSAEQLAGVLELRAVVMREES